MTIYNSMEIDPIPEAAFYAQLNEWRSDLNSQPFEERTAAFETIEVTYRLELNHISLENRNLTTIPPCLGRLSSLVTMSLKQNFLEALPETFDFLNNLEELDLSHNLISNIHTIEQSLTLPSLRLLFVEQNPISTNELIDWIPETSDWSLVNAENRVYFTKHNFSYDEAFDSESETDSLPELITTALP